MPLNVKMYNRYMNGVDRHDQLQTQYMVGRFSNKAWKYLLWFFVNAGIVNAWIIYQEISTRVVSKKWYSHIDFRVEVAKGLIANYSSRKRTASPNRFAAPIPGGGDGMHVNTHMGKDHVKLCVGHPTFMPQGAKHKRTAYGCTLCNVHLCKDCHFPWHQKHNVHNLP